MTAILCVPISAFWAWVAYSKMGYSLEVARQIFIVFAAISVPTCVLGFFANERQVRDTASKALPFLSVAVSASFACAVFYFLAKHDGEIVPGIIGAVTAIGTALFMLFGVRWKFE